MGGMCSAVESITHTATDRTVMGLMLQGAERLRVGDDSGAAKCFAEAISKRNEYHKMLRRYEAAGDNDYFSSHYNRTSSSSPRGDNPLHADGSGGRRSPADGGVFEDEGTNRNRRPSPLHSVRRAMMAATAAQGPVDDPGSRPLRVEMMPAHANTHNGPHHHNNGRHGGSGALPMSSFSVPQTAEGANSNRHLSVAPSQQGQNPSASTGSWFVNKSSSKKRTTTTMIGGDDDDQQQHSQRHHHHSLNQSQSHSGSGSVPPLLASSQAHQSVVRALRRESRAAGNTNVGVELFDLERLYGGARVLDDAIIAASTTTHPNVLSSRGMTPTGASGGAAAAAATPPTSSLKGQADAPFFVTPPTALGGRSGGVGDGTGAPQWTPPRAPPQHRGSVFVLSASNDPSLVASPPNGEGGGSPQTPDLVVSPIAAKGVGAGANKHTTPHTAFPRHEDDLQLVECSFANGNISAHHEQHDHAQHEHHEQHGGAHSTRHVAFGPATVAVTPAVSPAAQAPAPLTTRPTQQQADRQVLQMEFISTGFGGSLNPSRSCSPHPQHNHSGSAATPVAAGGGRWLGPPSPATNPLAGPPSNAANNPTVGVAEATGGDTTASAGQHQPQQQRQRTASMAAAPTMAPLLHDDSVIALFSVQGTATIEGLLKVLQVVLLAGDLYLVHGRAAAAEEEYLIVSGVSLLLARRAEYGYLKDAARKMHERAALGVCAAALHRAHALSEAAERRSHHHDHHEQRLLLQAGSPTSPNHTSSTPIVDEPTRLAVNWLLAVALQHSVAVRRSQLADREVLASVVRAQYNCSLQAHRTLRTAVAAVVGNDRAILLNDDQIALAEVAESAERLAAACHEGRFQRGSALNGGGGSNGKGNGSGSLPRTGSDGSMGATNSSSMEMVVSPTRQPAMGEQALAGAANAACLGDHQTYQTQAHPTQDAEEDEGAAHVQAVAAQDHARRVLADINKAAALRSVADSYSDVLRPDGTRLWTSVPLIDALRLEATVRLQLVLRNNQQSHHSSQPQPPGPDAGKDASADIDADAGLPKGAVRVRADADRQAAEALEKQQQQRNGGGTAVVEPEGLVGTLSDCQSIVGGLQRAMGLAVSLYGVVSIEYDAMRRRLEAAKALLRWDQRPLSLHRMHEAAKEARNVEHRQRIDAANAAAIAHNGGITSPTTRVGFVATSEDPYDAPPAAAVPTTVPPLFPPLRRTSLKAAALPQWPSPFAAHIMQHGQPSQHHPSAGDEGGGVGGGAPMRRKRRSIVQLLTEVQVDNNGGSQRNRLAAPLAACETAASFDPPPAAAPVSSSHVTRVASINSTASSNSGGPHSHPHHDSNTTNGGSYGAPATGPGQHTSLLPSPPPPLPASSLGRPPLFGQARDAARRDTPLFHTESSLKAAAAEADAW